MNTSRAAACVARFALIVTAVLVNAPRVRAQAAGPPPPVVVGSLGLSDLECDCTFNAGAQNKGRDFRFRSNPVVLGVRADGPSAGIIYRGDVIVDIDGYALRSSAGGRRFANVRPGVAVRLGIRRNGRYTRVRVIPEAVTLARASALGEYTPRVPTSITDDDEWSAPAVPATPRASRAPKVPVASTPTLPPTPEAAARAMATPRPGTAPEAAAAAMIPGVPAVPHVPPVVPASPASPRGWFGFSIRCNDCGWSRSGDEPFPRWESVSYPEVTRVDSRGPAAAAGIRSGDLITHVDGVSILTPEGGKRFGALLPGQRVRLGLLRSGLAITRVLRLSTRPGSGSAGRPLRYTGKLSNVAVEVWSPSGPMVEQIGDTIIIMIGNSVVRLKATGKE